MAQVLTRLNLASTAFPFLSEFSGRGIIVKQSDQNYVPNTTSKEDLDKDLGIPQVYYCHNVFGTGQGYQAVGYSLTNIGVSDLADFKDLIPVIDDAGNKCYLGWDAAGNIYTAVPPTFATWHQTETIPEFGYKKVTYAVINGLTYIYVSGFKCYKFNFTTSTLDEVTLAGLVSENILGIFACQGYLLVYSTNSVLWSSLLDPTDFVPSLTTGAGGGAVQNIRGDIVACVAHTTGFVVYTNQNAVTAAASGNTRYPFNFRELVASGGLFDINLVTYDSNTGSHYSYTTSGLQLISLIQSQTVIPELTDFIAGSVLEDFDESTDSFSITHLTAPMKKKLTLVADRYLVISYGVTSLTHALVYDTVSKRWSKLKVPHIKCFEFSLLQAETTTETPRRSMAFLASDGSIVTLRLDTRNPTASGVLLLGKIQYIRQRLTTLYSVEVENVQPESEFRLVDFYTLDGKTLLQKEGYCPDKTAQVRKYLFNQVGVNHSLLHKGNFNLVCVVTAVGVHGRR